VTGDAPVAWRGWTELRDVGHETLLMDEAGRERIARMLGLEGLEILRATVAHEPWLDGARVHGRVEAVAGRLCGISLEPFEESVDTSFDLRFVPEGSPNAPAPEVELTVSLDDDDPPDIVPGGGIDLMSYLIEALGLALDPFPRKAGVVFDYVGPPDETSPFSILKSATSRDPD
jgi:hypothetical protein